jgi:hypothetical protein
MAAVATRPAAIRRIPAIHISPALPAAIRSRHRDPQGSPNPSRLEGFNHLPTYPKAGGEGEGGEKEENGGARSSSTRREAGAAREEEPDPREPSTPATPCFLGFPFIASSICFPYQRRRLPRHRVAHLFTDTFTTGSPWTIGEHRVPLFPVDAAAIEPGRNVPRHRATAPPLVMPAIVPDWDEISCRSRCLHRRSLAR